MRNFVWRVLAPVRWSQCRKRIQPLRTVGSLLTNRRVPVELAWLQSVPGQLHSSRATHVYIYMGTCGGGIGLRSHAHRMDRCPRRPARSTGLAPVSVWLNTPHAMGLPALDRVHRGQVRDAALDLRNRAPDGAPLTIVRGALPSPGSQSGGAAAGRHRQWRPPLIAGLDFALIHSYPLSSDRALRRDHCQSTRVTSLGRKCVAAD